MQFYVVCVKLKRTYIFFEFLGIVVHDFNFCLRHLHRFFTSCRVFGDYVADPVVPPFSLCVVVPDYIQRYVAVLHLASSTCFYMLNFCHNRRPTTFLMPIINVYSLNPKGGMLASVTERRIVATELRLQCLFSTIISSGWGLVGGASAALVGSYRTIFSQSPRFSGSPRAIGSCASGSSRYNTYRGGTTALTIAPRLQWLNWSNLCLFFLSTQFYSLPVLGLSRVVHKTTISYFNWLSLGGDVSTPLWRRIHVLCFLKHVELARADQSILLFRRIGVALLVLVNVAFHHNIATRGLTANMPTVGLTDMLIEPWILWYPLFCDGGNPTNQLLFVSCLMYWRYWALSNRPA